MKSHHRGRSPHSLTPPSWRLWHLWSELGSPGALWACSLSSPSLLLTLGPLCPSISCFPSDFPQPLLSYQVLSSEATPHPESSLPPPTSHEPHLSQHEGFIGTVSCRMTFMGVVTRTVAQGLLRSRVQPEPWPLYLLLSFMSTPQFHEWETEAQRLVQGQAQNCHPFHSPFRDAVYFCQVHGNFSSSISCLIKYMASTGQTPEQLWGQNQPYLCLAFREVAV